MPENEGENEYQAKRKAHVFNLTEVWAKRIRAYSEQRNKWSIKKTVGKPLLLSFASNSTFSWLKGVV